MRTVAAETVYWVAVLKPRDQRKEPAKQARESLGNVRLLTTDEVLVEFLTLLCDYGPHWRRRAAQTARAILDDPNVKVLPQSRSSFLRALELYEARLDKQYSLTDCILITTMRSEGVSDILTNDTHFEQEGFNALMRAHR